MPKEISAIKNSGRIIKEILLVLFMSVFLGGCATPMAQLSNVQQVSPEKAIGKLYIGPFIDMREGRRMNTTWLGAKRGGYGNVLKRVTDERGADEFVREHIINAARTSGFLADRKPDTLIVKKNGNWIVESAQSIQDVRHLLLGVINKLSVEVANRRVVQVDIDLVLLNPNTGEALWSFKMVGMDSGGMGGGIFEDVANLKSWLAKLVQDEALKMFASPEFQKMVKSQ